MEILKERTVGNIVAEDYRTAGVFKKFGLDFCCGGGKPLIEACERKGVNIDELMEELDALSTENNSDQNYNEWALDFLADYIINQHHGFVRSKLPEIKAYAQKVAKVHGRTYPELNTMLEVFSELHDELLSHMDKEEEVLFPYIKKLTVAEKSGKAIEKPHFGTVANPVRMMEDEHEEAGALMAQLETLSNGYTPPQDACATFRVYFQNLQAFQDDLHKHVHLENNILFPKALELEGRLN